MNKINFFCFFLIFINIAHAETNDSDYYISDILDSIDHRFIGVYLPVGFIATIEKTKNFDTSMRVNSIEEMYDDFYQLIIIYKNKIIYWYYFGEGYSGVSKDEFKYYEFKYINENEMIIISPNGQKYQKMTDDLINYEAILNNYIANAILIDLVKKELILIENDIISILSLNKRFRICTFSYIYNYNENLLLREYESNDYYYLSIENNVYTIFWIEHNIYTSYKQVKRIIWSKQI